MKICKHCNKEIDDSYKYCVYCGHSCQESTLSETGAVGSKVCRECGREIGAFCKFCVYCGAKCQTVDPLKNLFWNVDAYHWLPQIVRQLALLEDRLHRGETDSLYDYVCHAVRNLKNVLAAPPQVMIVGSFSTGKSTFLNALFGESIAKVGALPTTAITTKLSYGPEDTLLVYFKNGDIENYRVDDFNQLTSEEGEEWQTLHNSILYVERFLPNDLLKSFSIIDSPGLDAKAEHTNQTKNFIERADVILWMFSAEHAVSAREVAAIRELDARYKPVAIINKIDTLDEEEDDLEDLLSSLKGKLGNLVSGVYPVSAQLAFEGKEAGNETFIKESLITPLEDYLNHDVITASEKYRMQVFLDTFSTLVFKAAESASGECQDSKYSSLFLTLLDSYDACQETIKSYSQIISSQESASLDLYRAAKELLFVSERKADWKTYSENGHFQAFYAYLVRAARSGQLLAIFWLAVLCTSNIESEDAQSFVDNCRTWVEELESLYKKDPSFLDHYSLDVLVEQDSLLSQTAVELVLSNYYYNSNTSAYLRYLELANTHGSTIAKLRLATYYDNQGLVIKAKPYWESLLSRKDDIGAIAYNKLGLLYLEGDEGIPQNLVKARDLLSVASQYEDPIYSFNYAEALLKSAIKEPSFERVGEWEGKATNLLESVYKKNTIVAEELMGIYMHGLRTIELSYEKAINIFKSTSEPSELMYFLAARIYLIACYGGSQGPDKALELSKKVSLPQQLFIEGMVAHVKDNIELARVKMQKAADLGFELAKSELERGLDNIDYRKLPTNDNSENDEEDGCATYVAVGIIILIIAGILIAFPQILIGIIVILVIGWVLRKLFS